MTIKILRESCPGLENPSLLKKLVRLEALAPELVFPAAGIAPNIRPKRIDSILGRLLTKIGGWLGFSVPRKERVGSEEEETDLWERSNLPIL